MLLASAVGADVMIRALREGYDTLLDLTFAWLGSRNPFKVEDKVYRAAA